PVPSAQKVPVKSFIDSVIWRMGDGLSGMVILAGTFWLHLSPSGMSSIVLILLAGWMFGAYLAKRQYVTNLSEGIHRHSLDAERAAAPVLDKFTSDILASRLTASDPKEILYALSLFDMGHQQMTHPAVRGLLKHE